MINVRAAANFAIQVVNPDIWGTFYLSTGNAPNAAFLQIPSYAAGVNQRMQVQAVSARDLRHLKGLSLQGVLRSVHMWGDKQGVVRVNQKGGDLLYFPQVPGGARYIWKVEKVIETWRDWSHLIVSLQVDASPPSPAPP